MREKTCDRMTGGGVRAVSIMEITIMMAGWKMTIIMVVIRTRKNEGD